MTKATPEKHITRADLTRSYVACYRLEDEIMARLRAKGLDERTVAARVLPALDTLAPARPAWCDDDAWISMLHMFTRWCKSYGNLQRFQELRRTKEKPVPTVALADESD